jgi:nucleotide-binding universal stress UspA family protein
MYQRILVPVDGSEPSMAAVREVLKITTDRARQIRLAHVMELQEWTATPAGTVGDILRATQRASGEKLLSDSKSILTAQGFDCDGVLLESHGESAAQAIIAHAATWLPDLIVMGTHGRKGVGRLILGSHAAEVVRTASIPVLLVRGA